MPGSRGAGGTSDLVRRNNQKREIACDAQASRLIRDTLGFRRIPGPHLAKMLAEFRSVLATADTEPRDAGHSDLPIEHFQKDAVDKRVESFLSSKQTTQGTEFGAGDAPGSNMSDSD